MKKQVVFLWYSLFIVLAIIGGSSTMTYAQSDTIQIDGPIRGTSAQCGFLFTLKNRNAAHSALDEVRLEIASGDATQFIDAKAPNTFWYAGITGPDNNPNLVDTFIATANVVNAGESVSGFGFEYSVDNGQRPNYDVPVNITWTTLFQGVVVSTGSIKPVCTTFQPYVKIDSVSATCAQVGTDPVFNMTFFNKNDAGFGQSSPIGKLKLQLQSNSGQVRPSKVSPPSGWFVDSVTATAAYFSAGQNPIDPNNTLNGFVVGLRSNSSNTKFNFSWEARDPLNYTIDRDTVFAIACTSGNGASESDSVYASTISSCLYALTVKNYHISNNLLPSTLTKVVLKMGTSGVKFDAAPLAPDHWTKTVSNDSIVYVADSLKYGIPSALVWNNFQFSTSGATSTDYTINWTTYRLTAPISSGSITTHCQIEAPKGDVATITANSDCSFKVTVVNQHNNPASDLKAVTLSIPSGSGTISSSGSSSGWTVDNPTGTAITFTTISGANQTTGQSQDFPFVFIQQNPGTPVQLTWATFDDPAKVATNQPISTDHFPINCNAPDCDSVWVAPVSANDCKYDFTIDAKGVSAVQSLVLTPDNGWSVDNATAPTDWTATIDANHTSVTYTSTTGVAPDHTLNGFSVQFKGIAVPSDFTVSAATKNQQNNSCTTSIPMNCTPSIDAVDPTITGSGLTAVSLVPNPMRGVSDLGFTALTNERVIVSVFDALGKTISWPANKIVTQGENHVQISLENQPAGSYYVRIVTPYGVMTKQLIKE